MENPIEAFQAQELRNNPKADAAFWAGFALASALLRKTDHDTKEWASIPAANGIEPTDYTAGLPSEILERIAKGGEWPRDDQESAAAELKRRQSPGGEEIPLTSVSIADGDEKRWMLRDGCIGFHEDGALNQIIMP